MIKMLKRFLAWCNEDMLATYREIQRELEADPEYRERFGK